MANKKDFTIEELEKYYQERKAETDDLKKMIEEMKKEEADRKKAQLELEKDNRKKEVDDAFQKYSELLKAYIKDYGSYKVVTSDEDLDWFPNKFWRSFF